MFDMGFTEIILIAIVALLFIGPDKLPETLKSIAKGIGKLKRAFEDTKETISNELQIDELKSEALKYKQQLEGTRDSIYAFKNVAEQETKEIKNSIESSVSSNFKNKKSNSFDEFEDDEFFDDKYFTFDDDDDDDFVNEPKKIDKKGSKDTTSKDNKNKEKRA